MSRSRSYSAELRSGGIRDSKECQLVDDKGDTELFDFVQQETVKYISREVSRWAAAEIEKYKCSEDMLNMIETMKRRERERVLNEIRLEVENERKHIRDTEIEVMRLEETEKIQSAEKILEENRLKLYEQKMRQDAERLRLIQTKQELEEVT